MLADERIVGVIVATPHASHTAIIEAAAAAGKHVFVEKPLALTVEDAHRAIAVTRDAGLVLQVGHNRRRQPANRIIQGMISRGELGTVVQLAGLHTADGALGDDVVPWRRDPIESPAGGMTALGVHLVDTFHAFAGPAARVSAMSKRVMGISALDEATSVSIEYASGPIGHIGTSYVVPGAVVLSVWGTDAIVWNDDDGGTLVTLPRGGGKEIRSMDPFDTIEDELAEFLRCIRDDVRPETGGPEGLEVAAVLEAIVQSVATGRTVDVDRGPQL
jgi:predicted dehydrogenase